MENPINIDDLGVPLFLETPLWYVPTLGKLQDSYWIPFSVFLFV